MLCVVKPVLYCVVNMDIAARIKKLRKEFDHALQRIDFDALVATQKTLSAESQAPDFWQDNLKAQDVMQQLSKLETRIEPWQKLRTLLAETEELVALSDASLQTDLEQQIEQMEDNLESLRMELAYSGPNDQADVLLSVHAGAGGTDAQDWAQMLLRMYVRWAEQNGCKVSTIDESAGDEAGIKSATVSISGSLAYGKLKGEHGVHRLVRLSPYNANNLRQTSFAKVEVLPKIDQPDALLLDEKELKIDVYRAGGHGGQSVNTTDSAVRITHLPTGITVSIQNERSQLQNKETAMTILRSKLVQLQLEQHLETVADLKGPNQSAEWGNQIRSYVLHPYKQVKDLRSGHESKDPNGVLDGDLNPFITSFQKT